MPLLLCLAILSACGDGAARTVDSGATAPDAHVVDAYTSDGTSDGAAGSQLVFSASFPGSDSAWPQPWETAGGVAVADVVAGRGRLAPVLSAYSLARMVAPGSETNVEATFEIEFDELNTQGIGFYVRQNGGYLDQSSPTGAGYAVFIEGFRGPPAIGVWRERDGHEEQLANTLNPTPNMQSGVAYRVRFRAQQAGASTELSAKIWPVGQAEPAAWSVEATDTTPSLQNLAGGYAVDAWNSGTTGPPPPNIWIDDIAVYRGQAPL